MKKGIFFFMFFGTLLAGCHDDLAYIEDSGVDHPNTEYGYDPSVLFAEWETQNTTRTRSGEVLYPDWYGGCFQENDLLVFQCADEEKAYLIPEGTKYRVCSYSYNELDSISDIISDRLMTAEQSCFSNVVGFGISCKFNRIEVIMHNTSDADIEKFKNNVYSEDEYLMFKNISELIYPNSSSVADAGPLPLYPESYIICGSELINPYTSNKASLGYRVKDKNGKKGFMTAGHFVYEGKYVTTADRDTLGLCKQCYRRNIMDASYCELTDDYYELTNHIRTFAIDTLSVKSVQPIEDAPVMAIGYRNVFQGKVLDHSFELPFVDSDGHKRVYTDQILFDFASSGGNSGGVVCYRDKTTKQLMTVGIMGGNCTTNVAPVLGRTVAFCCKQNVIETVMGVRRY